MAVMRHYRSLAPALPLAEIYEDAWDAQLFRGRNAVATMLGWTSYHTLRSKGSKGGYPDRTLVRDRIIFAELKRDLTGKKSEDANRQPTAAQVEWLDKLATVGAEVYLWRPSDLDEIGLILGGRWTLSTGGTVEHGRWLLRYEHVGGVTSARDRWTPRSLWIPGVGRADTTEQQQLLTKGAA